MSLRKEYERAVDKCNRLIQTKQKLQGRLEAAQATLDEVEEECRRRGIDPDGIDEAISSLKEKYKATVEAFMADVDKASESLSRYEDRNT